MFNISRVSHYRACGWASVVLAVAVFGGAAAAPVPDDDAPAPLVAPPASELVAPTDATNGPAHSFRLARYEVTNAEFVRFLNSMESNRHNALGTNMFFDAEGNVWINPARRRGRDEVFSIAKSRLRYVPDRPAGQRYSVSPRRPRFGGNYERHPISGVSWLGAVKYCNWLTLATGMPAAQRCYREGTNVLDWAPATCAPTNWARGVFENAERERWLRFEGYRLPMSPPPETTEDDAGAGGDGATGVSEQGASFGEFEWASTWDGTTNRLYGFGRDTVSANDANLPDPEDRRLADTLPVGFFDGDDHRGRYPTTSNANFYGINDLSGNVEEWVTDFARQGTPGTRAAIGGSWRVSNPVIKSRKALPPSATSDVRGFRVASAALKAPRKTVSDFWSEVNCDDYGGDRALASTIGNLDAYVSGGDIVLDMDRWEIADTNAVTCPDLDEDGVDVNDLDEDLQLRIAIWGRQSLDIVETTDTTAARFFPTDPRTWVSDIPTFRKTTYSDAYPGIDISLYAGLERWELVLTSRAGSDFADVTLDVRDTESFTVDAAGNRVYDLTAGKFVLGSPIVHEGVSTGETGLYDFTDACDVPFSAAGPIRIDLEPTLDVPETRAYGGGDPRDPPDLVLVSASGDTNGPAYDFHVSEFEITNGDFVDFLNSAEANTNNLLGTNMYFDTRGNVWINPEMRIRRDELFSMAGSRLTYNREAEVGDRYALTARRPVRGQSYTNHPVAGVSWYGAVKYCNWLTLVTGRGAGRRCYREGTNTVDWAPVTCAETNWVNGHFPDEARARLVRRDGFRLPMQPGHADQTQTGAFSECYKAATWMGATNTLYGYGRNEVEPRHANFYHDDLRARPDTFPVGYFDGDDHDGRYPTHTNANFYGIHDMSGNVAEWVTDVGLTNSTLNRAYYGGSWRRALPTLTERHYARAYDTATSRGFRVVSTRSTESRIFIIRIPLYICLCGYVDVGRVEEVGEEEIEPAEEEEPEWSVLTVEEDAIGDIEGVLLVETDEEDEEEDEAEEEEEAEEEDEDIDTGGIEEFTTIQP